MKCCLVPLLVFTPVIIKKSTHSPLNCQSRLLESISLRSFTCAALFSFFSRLPYLCILVPLSFRFPDLLVLLYTRVFITLTLYAFG